MPNELQIIEQQFEPLLPALRQALAGTMPVERLARTVIVSCERTPKLLTADRQSLFNAAMTFAVLGLEVDGVTGQGFLVPFEDKKNKRTVVQPIIGYLGYNTLGARAGMTITGRVVREGDRFEYDEGCGVVHHVRKLGNECDRRIIAAWAKAQSNDRPSIVRVLSIDELTSVRDKSQRGKSPPWSDPEIGFPAMCEKTAKRRLRRDMPLSVYQSAARMEEAYEEQGLHSWIGPNGVMVEGELMPPRHNTETPTVDHLINPPTKEQEARMAAQRGKDALNSFCRRLSKSEYASIVKPIVDELKEIAEKADNET